MSMTSERYKQIGDLYHRARELPPAARSELLERACGDDPELRGEVESLLAADDSAGAFLHAPATDVAAKLLRAETPRTLGRVGRYRLLSAIGHGGMGDVYLAEDAVLGRQVAIKLLAPPLTADARALARFEQEARAASSLNHPNIVTIHEIGLADDGRYIAMEFVEGHPLSGFVGHPMQPSTLLPIARQVAQALSVAHAAGIVHRDVKPENIMLRPDGYVKLLDFGVARLLAPRSEADGSATSMATHAGLLIGTPRYMSPEQIRGEPATPASDVFALGAVLHELATGKHPSEHELTARNAAAPGAELPAQRPAQMSRGFAELVRRMLDPDPLARPSAAAVEAHLGATEREGSRWALRHVGRPTALTAAVALVGLFRRTRFPAEAPPSRRTRRLAWVTAGVILLAGIVSAAWWLAPSRSTPDVSPAREVPLTTLQGYETSPTLAPDGEQVAFSWGGPNHDNVDIYIQRIGSGSEVQRTVHSARDFSPTWSPDGRWIAFLRGEVPGRSELILIPPLGGTEQRLAEVHIPNQIYPNYLSWFPDSSALVVVHAASQQTTAGLFVVSVKTRELRPLTRPTGSSYHQFPAVSPDGRTVAFRNGSALSLLALTPDMTAAGEPWRLVETPGFQNPTWTPDGKAIIYVQSSRLWRIDVTGEHPPRRLPIGGEGAIMPAISRSVAGSPSRLIYVRRSADQNLWRIDLPASGAPTRSAPIRFPSSTRTDYNAQFSPDGKRLAFQSNRSGPMEIWVSDADGANAQQLTAIGTGNTGTPRWSPDGQTIAFDSNAEGSYEIYVVSSGGGEPTRLTFEPTDDHVPSFSRDGRFVYFSSRRSGAFEIWKVPVSGGDAVRVTRNGGYVAFESFDGRHVYYTQTAVGPSTLWRIPTAGGDPTRVLEGVSERAFEVLERGIYYIERLGEGAKDWGFLAGNDPLGPDDRARLRFFEFVSSKNKVLAELGERVRYGLAVSPNGRTIVFTRLDNPSSDLMLVENFR